MVHCMLKRLVKVWDETIQQRALYLLRTKLKLCDSLVRLPRFCSLGCNTWKRESGKNLPLPCIMHEKMNVTMY